MKNRPSAGPARKRRPSDERGRPPGNRPSARVSSRAPNAGKTRAVSGPGRSEFSAKSRRMPARRTRSLYALLRRRRQITHHAQSTAGSRVVQSRLLRVTAKSPDGGDLQPSFYVVAEEDFDKSHKDCLN